MENRLLTTILISLFLFSSCSSQKAVIQSRETETTVALDADEALLDSEAAYFNERAIDLANQQDLIYSIGDSLLKTVINSYDKVSTGLSYSDDPMNAERVIFIEKIEIDNAFFMTLNAAHPGPFLKVSMTASLWNGKDPVETKMYSSRVNMSSINFENEMIHWMTKTEKRDPDLQVRTLERALKNLYKKLYSESFGISI